MSEEKHPTTSVQKASQGPSDNLVAIISIVAVAIVTLACIFACAFVGYIFFSNPPW